MFTRKIVYSSDCLLCATNIEDTNHILRECPATLKIWNSLNAYIPNKLLDNCFNNLSFKKWLHKKCTTKDLVLMNIPWNTVFSRICWNMWKSRNASIFETGNSRLLDFHHITSNVIEFITHNPPSNSYEKIVTLSWPPPQEYAIKINTYGSVKSNPSFRGARSVSETAKVSGFFYFRSGSHIVLI